MGQSSELRLVGIAGYEGVVPHDRTTAVLAAVVSTPEPGTAVVGAGKRDLPYDVEPPVVVAVHDAAGRAKSPAGWPAYVVTDGSGHRVDVWTTRFDRPSVL